MFLRIGVSMIILGWSVASHAGAFIDWAGLKNPVYEHEGWSVKDACMTYKDGWFYLFFSAFFWDEGRERSHVSGVKTRDFTDFSDPLFIWDGMDDGWIGMCSPNLTQACGTYYLTYNSWGDKDGKPNQLFYAVSTDLETWRHNLPLASHITVDEDGNPRRAIDAAVAYRNDRFYLVWKEKQTPCMAVAPAMGPDGWTRLGEPGLGWFENGQFIEINGRVHMLATARGPEPQRDHLPHLAPMKDSGDEDAHWTQWEALRVMSIPEESFNTDGRANAAYLADWREHDGHFYLLYAGRTEGKSHLGRGDNRLGLARSTDLIRWDVP